MRPHQQLLLQTRLQQRSFWRSPESAFFNFAMPLGVLLILFSGLHCLVEGQAKSIDHAQWSGQQGDVSSSLLLLIELLLPRLKTMRLCGIGVDLPKERQLSLRGASSRLEVF